MYLNKLTTISIQISKDMFSSFKAARVNCEIHLEDEREREMTPEKESRKTVINEEIESVKNTITGKEKERVVLKKEAFDVTENM